MDTLDKFVKKLSLQERTKLKEVIQQVLSGDIKNLDIKKLKGHVNIFRIRVGNHRIVFTNEQGITRIIFIGRKSDVTYKKF